MCYTYLLLMIVSFIYSLSFMTEYQDLALFVLPKNESITLFHEELQAFNANIFWFSVVGLASIITLYALEINKKVPDKLAAIIMTVFVVVNVVLAIYEILGIIRLIEQYNLVEFKYMYLEDTSMVKEDVYVRKFNTFYVGYALSALLAIVPVTFATSLWTSHFSFMKKMKDGDFDEIK